MRPAIWLWSTSPPPPYAYLRFMQRQTPSDQVNTNCVISEQNFLTYLLFLSHRWFWPWLWPPNRAAEYRTSRPASSSVGDVRVLWAKRGKLNVGSLFRASHSTRWHWQLQRPPKSVNVEPAGKNKHMADSYLLIRNLILWGDLAGEQLKTQTFLFTFKPDGKNTNNCQAK